MPPRTKNSDSPLTQTERTNASRSALIDATVTVLAAEGYKAASMSRIQEIAGVSRGLIGYHFGSKLQLMEAVVEHVRDVYFDETGVGRTESADTGLDRVRDHVSQYLTRLSTSPEPSKAMLVLATESVNGPTELAAALRSAFAAQKQMIAEFVREGIIDGSIRPDVSPDGTAAVVQGILRGVVLINIVDPEDIDLAEARSTAIEMVNRQLAVS
ncbi:TetR/AcrR family transcriptional regulator [Rhodococcus sp. IEGM 1379]|uniref:TetR/AcrR family transcriptional regulator n=1 Tax=Rhodococcus sp. IEGM 1379 TaxID=3047086 RepID=UPI0024B82EA5|nr:TetR/AcrR family transcriptional regulator [Rhodococcus sp. IEGM 1379]MDI9915363.1 TetR/AcrR family transcriptional regulator [Rhodococcus sp. IEGM 1379]